MEMRCAAKMRGLGVLCVLIAVSCAAGPPPGRSNGDSYPSYVFRGRSEALEQLILAAKACGYADLEMSLETPHLTPVVILRDDARFECVARWIRQHPEAGFSVGPSR